MSSIHLIRRSLVTATAIFSMFATGCSIKDVVKKATTFEPSKSVIIEVEGIRSDEHRDQIYETLQDKVDAPFSIRNSRLDWSGRRATVTLSPVTDVDAFAKKIDFGMVQSVEQRTIVMKASSNN